MQLDKRIWIRLTEETKKKIKIESKKNGRTLSGECENIFRKHFKK